MTKGNLQMDERMLWIRGNVFKHSFIAAIVLLLTNGLVQDWYGAWASPWFENLIILFLLVTFTSVEMIVREVYVTGPGQKISVAIIGLCGLILLGLNTRHVFFENERLLENGALTSTGSSLCLTVMFLAIALSYVITQQVAKRRLAEDED